MPNQTYYVCIIGIGTYITCNMLIIETQIGS